MGILEDQPVGADPIARLGSGSASVGRRLDEPQLAAGTPDHLGAGHADRVDDSARMCARQQRFGPCLDLGQVAVGVLVDRADPRARQDVVELVEEQQLPQPFELSARVVAGEDPEELDVVERLLAAAVPTLDARLRGVGAAVVLEVELSEHGRVGPRLRLEGVEELAGACQGRPREPLQVGGPL